MSVDNLQRDAHVFVAAIFCQVCEFCESGPATKHCPDDVCGFMCDSCDAYRHGKRDNKAVDYADHKRAKVRETGQPLLVLLNTSSWTPSAISLPLIGFPFLWTVPHIVWYINLLTAFVRPPILHIRGRIVSAFAALGILLSRFYHQGVPY